MSENIQLYQPSDLSEQQLATIPMVAMGVSLEKIATIHKVPLTKLKQWVNADAAYKIAVAVSQFNREKILKEQMDQAGVLATQYAIDVLSSPVDDSDIEGRRNKANLAKSVLSMISSRKVEVKLEATGKEELHNIDATSQQILAEYSGSAESYVVLDNVAILEDEPLMHKDCEYGKLNTDRENQKIQCHICGRWESDFVVHIRSKHNIAPPRYRKLYKLDDSIAFNVESDE